MLDPDLDLEAELSIDSIKRIEILAELADRIELPGMDDGEVADSIIEELAMVKTLRGVVECIVDHRDSVDPVPATPVFEEERLEPNLSSSKKGVGKVLRYVPRPVQLPKARATRSLADAGVAVVADMSSPVAARLAELLKAEDAIAHLVGPTDPLPDHIRYLVDLTALSSGDGTQDEAIVRQFERLRAAALAEVGDMLVVTGLGGSFALPGGKNGSHPAPWELAFSALCTSAGAQGLVRTLALEFPGLRPRLVDVSAGADPLAVSRQVMAELRCGDEAPLEVGYASRRRHTIELVASTLDLTSPSEHGDEPDASGSPDKRNDLHLGPHAVVLITGGARGIGARCAIGLARRFHCVIEVVGRALLPSDEEPADLAGAVDPVAVRRAIIERGEYGRPSEIESEVSRVLAAREIRATLQELRLHAASVDYHTVDVRDVDALAALVEGVRKVHGRLDGVVHAAGVVEDKRIADKTTESFARVFDTKVRAAELLADAPDFGGFAVFFGSVAGVFGNVGQVDYAAANSVLDVLARSRSGVNDPRRRQRRLLSVDWGPWSGVGMVTPELAREYGRRGVAMIDADAGVACLLAELGHGARDPQVVLMCGPAE
jgi:NAD(P)-dependent dehydrogenase (short-subunit alcohol dehydrogenase family)